MNERLWSLILYPALADGLTGMQRKILLTVISGKQEGGKEQFLQSAAARLSLAEVQTLAVQIPADQKATYYTVAKQIATEGGLSAAEAQGLRELREALGLAADVSGIKPAQQDDHPQLVEQEVHEIALKYSRLAAALAFLPLPYIDTVGIVSLQTRMVAKIASAYEFELQAKQFVSMIIDKVGVGCGLALIGGELLHLVPIVGWAISAGLIFEVTYAIAIVTRRYIELDGNMGEEDLKRTYQEAYAKVKKDLVAVKRKTLAAKDKLSGRLKEYRKELGR